MNTHTLPCCMCGRPVPVGSVLFDGRHKCAGCPLPADHPCAHTDRERRARLAETCKEKVSK